MNINGSNIEGWDTLNHMLENMPKHVKKNVCTILIEDLMDLQGCAQEIVPYLHGYLQGSADSGAQETATGVQGFVSFDTPYAAYQHEMMDLVHENGRVPKYLETPLKENIDQYIMDITDTINGTLKP
jgi:hypothetical protein